MRPRQVDEFRRRGELLPLEYMLSVMRDVTKPEELRLLAAVKAAPYMHARLCGGAVLCPFEMSDEQVATAITKQQQHEQRLYPGKPDLRLIEHEGQA